jgi:alkylation response protein AidB-like acyl-CoA dehydrogenase
MSQSEEADPVVRAEALTPMLQRLAAEIERQRRLPQALLDAILDAGLFGLLLPRAYGGVEVEPVVFMRVLEEVARHDASTAWCLGQNGVCAMASAYLAPEAARAVWGEGRGVLAWGIEVPPPKAIAVPGGYRVSGSWSFASGGHHATWLGGHCIVAEIDGTPRKSRTGTLTPRTLLFPASEVAWTDIWDVIGLKGTGSDRYSVTDLFVPEEFTLNRDDPGERRLAEPLYLFHTDQMYASGFACVALGIARGMLEAFISLANEKIPRGYKTTMRMSAVVQTDVAEIEARLRAARSYVFSTMEAAWRAAQQGELSTEHRMAIRLATTHCIREARKIADDAYNAAGATSVFSDNPFERRLRDINAVSQQFQGRRSHFETVGKYLLGVETEASLL